MGARLVVDLAETVRAKRFIEIDHAHVSGVSVITGGEGLRRFLKDLTDGEGGPVRVPTTLNAAGCDLHRVEQMGIEHPDFLGLQLEIIDAYRALGIEATLSCTPYDRAEPLVAGVATWAESNAVCYANSYTSLVTNRESGLSALASALTGYAPEWGLHLEEHRKPNLVIRVEAELHELGDHSILGDWVGSVLDGAVPMPFGPMPAFIGLPKDLGFAQRKALSAAAANHGVPMLFLDADPTDLEGLPVHRFSQEDLEQAWASLAPEGQVDLVVIGCPQASLEEIRRTASEVRARAEMGHRIPDHRLWVFTSSETKAVAEQEGLIELLEQAGALVLVDTCPEVTPYPRSKYNHLLTNSMKAEHYLTSGLNRMPTSAAPIPECVAHAFDPSRATGPRPTLESTVRVMSARATSRSEGPFTTRGHGLASQGDRTLRGRALVSTEPITWLGYVDRDSGRIDHRGHPLDGHLIEGTILVHPRGSGSTVAPYVLMGLIYGGRAPKALLTRSLCPLAMPACSLLDLPYAHGFDLDPCVNVNSGDLLELRWSQGTVDLEVVERAGAS